MMGEASAPAPAGMHHKHHPWPAMAPGPAGYSGCEKHHEEHDEQNDADLTFILSADQVGPTGLLLSTAAVCMNPT